jgi:hypothetical protein
MDVCALVSIANTQCAAPPLSTIFHTPDATTYCGILLEPNATTIIANDQVHLTTNDTAPNKCLRSFSVAMDVGQRFLSNAKERPLHLEWQLIQLRTHAHVYLNVCPIIKPSYVLVQARH